MFTTPVSTFAYSVSSQSDAYHDKHGKLVAVEGSKQQRHVEVSHEGVDRVGNGQNDEGDKQHQEDEGGVTLRVHPVKHSYHSPRRRLHEGGEAGVGRGSAGGADRKEAKVVLLLLQARADGCREKVQGEEA